MDLFRQKKVQQCEHNRPGPPSSDNVKGTAAHGKNAFDKQPAPQRDGETQAGPCEICRKEQLAARSYRIKLIIGLFVPFALQALDVTIIASALPWIASDFSKFT